MKKLYTFYHSFLNRELECEAVSVKQAKYFFIRQIEDIKKVNYRLPFIGVNEGKITCIGDHTGQLNLIKEVVK